MSTLPKGVHKVPKQTKDGPRTYYYWRPTGERLPDDPGSEEFAARIAAFTAHEVTTVTTWRDLVTEYKRSNDYRSLTPSTRAYYDRHLLRVKKWEPLPVESIKRRNVLAFRDLVSEDAPQAANQLVIVLSKVFEFAVDREYREANPCHKIKRIKGGEWQPWSDEQVAFALKAFAEHYRRAIVLALYTGQREGDCCAMVWGDFDGSGIQVSQHKTGKKLWIPCHKVLRAELNKWRPAEVAPSDPIITTERGTKWDPRSFSTMISRRLREHEQLAGCVFHGLRKTAAVKLAEAGCSEREIMSITGHETSSMVDLYAKGAAQKRRALRAISKMEND